MEAHFETLLCLAGSAREAMHNARQSRWLPMVAEDRDRVLPSVARMDDYRHASGGRDLELLHESRCLDLFRSSPMVVQPDLTYRLNLWMLQQPFQTFKSPRIEFGSIVRMNAHSGEAERISFSQADCGFEI